MFSRRQILATAAAAPLLRGAPAFAQASRKPVRIVVGFPAGGGTDIIARLVAEKLRGSYAPAVIVENRPGAAARLAVDFVKNAEPDGSTLLFTPDFPLTVYPHSYQTLSYNPVRDLTAVACCTSSMLTINAGPGLPSDVKNIADFVTWAKANPGKAAYGTTSAGSTPHFVGVMLARAARVELTAVHYKGGAPALQDVLGGHIPVSVNPISEAIPFAQAGSTRVLAVTGPRRSRFLPNVPTMVESGYPEVAVESWLGLFGPAKIPAETLASLDDVVGKAVRSPEMAESLARIGNEPNFIPSAQFGTRLEADVEKWGPVVKASGFVAED
jgi:tripartite-type tricarboxylate transporter receptor subunit TctC